VDIRTEGYNTLIPFKEALNGPGVSANIVIEDYVWIGANVFICGGVVIGENSIVGANSVVTHNLPPNSICAGVPAKLIRYKPDGSEANSLHKIEEDFADEDAEETFRTRAATSSRTLLS
jgi:acetyltransferase-like isoleucine patch superfamily enzyme